MAPWKKYSNKNHKQNAWSWKEGGLQKIEFPIKRIQESLEKTKNEIQKKGFLFLRTDKYMCVRVRERKSWLSYLENLKKGTPKNGI